MRKNLCLVTTFVMCFATAMHAGIISGSSSYGGNMSSSPASCTTSPTTSFSSFTFSCDTGDATVFAEAFTASTNSDLVMFDFSVTGAPSDYTLTLTSTGAPINSANDLGLFICDPSAPPQCSNDLPPGVTSTSDYGSLLSADVASFPVSGAAPTDTFVFFVALDDPEGTAANVTASLEAATSATPEPNMLPLLGCGLLALMAFHRRINAARRGL
jgi:hypothetical protein